MVRPGRQPTRSCMPVDNFSWHQTMEDGANIAAIAAPLGDSARANMLGAPMFGQALTASELAEETGVMLSTASRHLGRLADAGLATIQMQTRHHYFRQSGVDVARVLEGLIGVAARTGHRRLRTGPDPELAAGPGLLLSSRRRRRRAQIRAPRGGGHDSRPNNGTVADEAGERFFSALGIDLNAAASGRRPLAPAWTEASAGITLPARSKRNARPHLW
jgi:DNA-binding transcriptional ArsR family regulator